MHDTEKDKLLELARYDARAKSLLLASGDRTGGDLGSSTMPEFLRSPYICYEQYTRELITSQDDVLELGAGSGLHTWTLAQAGGRVTATDISTNSLKLLEQRLANAGADVKTQVADIESLPFADASFDVVACAGSLSYGEPTLVDAEIKRVLRPGGRIICVDSLNHQPIYRLNRWLHYLRGARTKSTLQRMPDLARIAALSSGFASVKVHYFGALTFAMPALAQICGTKRAAAVSDFSDRLIGVRRSAFKFVLVAEGLRKTQESRRIETH